MDNLKYKMREYAKKQPDDEFYTRREDIDAMLPEWDLSDKIVYCPADSDESEFVKYFKQPGKCKELIYTSDDFRTHEDLFEKCDIVVTNPPFSLIRVLVGMVFRMRKDFILIQPNIPSRAVPSNATRLFEDYFYFKKVTHFSNREKTSVCSWVSNIGTKEHPYGYSFKEVFGKELPICPNPGEQVVVAHSREVPIRKFGKRTGFPPRDFEGVFVVTSDNCVSEFKPVTYDELPGLVRHRGVFYDCFVKWRNN